MCQTSVIWKPYVVTTPGSSIQYCHVYTVLGIGDIAIDTDNGNLWVLEWSGGRILRYSLASGGAPLDSFDLGLDGSDAGITYYNQRLYYWDWQSDSNSILNIYGVTGAYAATAASIPTLSIWSMILLSGLLAMGTIISLRRRRH